MQNLNTGNFKIAASISFVMALLIFAASAIIGKNELFLLLNNNAGKLADQFFATITWAGDGTVFIPALLIIFFLLKRKDVFPLLLGSFAISTIITQVFKNFILSDQPRPTKAISDTSLIHTVTGVDIHTIGSFPSGHTTTAFCIYFLFCLLLPKKWWIAVGMLYALLVGYSRIYLAQHFPVDVAGGIIAAIISVYLSLKIQQRFTKNG